MKRVLLVGYVFPPQPSPGALRPAFLARYLPAFGWEATVLTHTPQAPPFPARVIHSNSRFGEFADRLPFRLRNALFFPDATMGWVPNALASGLHALRTEHYDAILGTALPPSVHFICSMLSYASGVPWIADYRDPWTGNTYARRTKLRSYLEARLERALLRRARAITTISGAVSQAVCQAVGRSDIETIPNAYDPAEWEAFRRTASGRFDLVFTGSMYDGKRPPDLLLAALAKLRDRGDPAGSARVHFYGPNSEFVLDVAKRFGVQEQVLVHGTVPRAAAMQAQRNAAATLIFLSMTNSGAEEMGSKFLEYLGARRPMIAFGPRGNALDGFLRDHQLGWFASDEAQAQSALRSAYEHFRQGSADTSAQPAEFPTAKQLAERFARCLDAACAGRHSTLTDFTLETARGEFECR